MSYMKISQNGVPESPEGMGLHRTRVRIQKGLLQPIKEICPGWFQRIIVMDELHFEVKILAKEFENNRAHTSRWNHFDHGLVIFRSCWTYFMYDASSNIQSLRRYSLLNLDRFNTNLYPPYGFKDFFEVRWAHVRVHLVLFLVFRRLLRLLPLIFCMVDALRQNKVRVSSHSASFFYCCCLCDLHAHTPPISLSLNPIISPFFSGDDLNEDFEWRLCWELPEQPRCSPLFSLNSILWPCKVYIIQSFLLLPWPRSLSFSAIILSAFFVQQDGHTIFCLLRESLLDLLRDRTFDQTFISRQVSLVCAW